MISGSFLSPVPVFLSAALLLGISIMSFSVFIRLNRRNKKDFDKKLAAYNEAVEKIRQQEEAKNAKPEGAKKPAAVKTEASIANSPRRIQFMAPNGASYDVPMIESLTIGNNQRCDLCIKKTGIEPIHCKINYEDGIYTITDNGTASGTFFDGNRVAPNTPTEIKTGVLQLGRYTYFMTIG